MATFQLRSSSTASALRSATLDTLRPRSFDAGWNVYIAGTNDTTRIDLASLRLSDSGSDAVGRLQARHADPSKAFAIPAGAIVEVTDGTQVVWGGSVIGRSVSPAYGTGQSTAIEAGDWSAQLDATYIPSDSTPAGWDDRAAIQYIVGGHSTRGLRAPDFSVAVTNTSLPALAFANVTLRQAIAAIGEAAGANRFYYVDPDNRLWYGIATVTTAPYAITDTSPNGTTTIAAETLVHEADESQIVNAVWAYGETYGEWVSDATSIAAYGRRESVLQNSAITDSASAQFWGLAYIAKLKDPVVRGSFTVSRYDGWKAGQVVSITNGAAGLSGAQYLITQVETTFLTGTPRRLYRISYGALSRSLVRALAAE